MSLGLRLNNPLYLNQDSCRPWKGEVRPSEHIKYCQFKSMAYGYRAAFKWFYNLHKDGCERLIDYILKVSPSDTHNTYAHVDYVAKRCGLVDISRIDVMNKEQMCKIIAALSRLKNYRTIPDADEINEGWELFIEYL